MPWGASPPRSSATRRAGRCPSSSPPRTPSGPVRSSSTGRTRSAATPTTTTPGRPAGTSESARRPTSKRRGGRTSTSRVCGRTRTRPTAAWFQRRGRASLSPSGARDLILMNSKADVRDVLPSVQCPTLVLHRAGDLDASVEEGRYIAARIPGARFVELAGDNHVPLFDPDQILDEAEEFLTGVRPAPSLGPRARHGAVHRPRRVDGAGRRPRRRGVGSASPGPQRRGPGRARPLLRRGDRHGGGRVLRPLRRAGAGDPLRARDSPGATARSISKCGPASTRARSSVTEVTSLGASPCTSVHASMSLADAGEVLVSSTTRDLVAGSGLEFDDRGEHELKGVEGPRRLFAAR